MQGYCLGNTLHSRALSMFTYLSETVTLTIHKQLYIIMYTIFQARYTQVCDQTYFFMISCAASVSKSKKKVNIVVAVVVSITSLAILLAIAGFIWRAKKNKARKPGDI